MCKKHLIRKNGKSVFPLLDPIVSVYDISEVIQLMSVPLLSLVCERNVSTESRALVILSTVVSLLHTHTQTWFKCDSSESITPHYSPVVCCVCCVHGWTPKQRMSSAIRVSVCSYAMKLCQVQLPSECYAACGPCSTLQNISLVNCEHNSFTGSSHT